MEIKMKKISSSAALASAKQVLWNLFLIACGSLMSAVAVNGILTPQQFFGAGFTGVGKYLTGNRRQGTPGGDHDRGKGRLFGTGNSDHVHGHYLPRIAPPEKTRSGYRSQCLYGGLGYAGSHGHPHRKSASLVMDDGLSFV